MSPSSLVEKVQVPYLSNVQPLSQEYISCSIANPYFTLPLFSQSDSNISLLLPHLPQNITLPITRGDSQSRILMPYLCNLSG